MVKGLDVFRDYFAEYTKQYVLIGGTACDISFGETESNFRATKDLDMVLVVEAQTKEFGKKFWELYYELLLTQNRVIDNLSVLTVTGLALFKAKAWLDLNKKAEKGEHIDSRDIKKHRNDILRIASELVLEPCELPDAVRADMREFIEKLQVTDAELKNLGIMGIHEADIKRVLADTYKV